MKVFIVTNGSAIDSAWDTVDGAQARAAALNKPGGEMLAWSIVSQPVQRAPVSVGDCRYCVERDGQPTNGSKLYANETMATFPDGSIAHVACEIDARRRNRGHG